ALREHNEMAVDLLHRCAFFGPEPIPRYLLDNGRLVLAEPLRARFADRLLVGQALRDLGRYALARIDSPAETVPVHRLGPKPIRAALGTDDAAVLRRDVHTLLAAADPGDASVVANWPRYGELHRHAGPSGLVTSDEPDHRGLHCNVTEFLFAVGDHEA